MNNRQFILDKNYRFSYECSIIFIAIISLVVCSFALLSYITEPEYSSKEPVLETGLLFLVLAIAAIFARLTLKRYVYIELKKQEIRIYFKVFLFEATYLVAAIRDIQEIGISSIRYTSSFDGKSSISDYYYLVLLRKDGKVRRFSSENGDLIYTNEQGEKLAKKIRKPILHGKQGIPVCVQYDTQNSKYKLSYSSGLKASFARANCYEKVVFFLFILINIILLIST